MSNVASLLLDPKRNLIINGNFAIDQRHASTNSSPNSYAGASDTPDYTFDRWRMEYDEVTATTDLSRELETLGESDQVYFARIAHTSSSADGTFFHFSQRVESVRTSQGRRVGVAFVIGGTASTVQVQLVQNFGTGGSPSSPVLIAAQNVSVTSTRTRKELYFDVLGIGGKTLGTNGDDYLELRFILPINTTFSYDLSEVVMTEGTVQPFRLASMDGDELRLCQRYFEKSYNVEVRPGTASTTNGNQLARTTSSGAYGMSIDFKVTKRATPTATAYSPVTGTSGQFRVGGGDVAGTFIHFGQTGLAKTDSGITANTDATAQWTAEAEL
jgi:hypothetical protein